MEKEYRKQYEKGWRYSNSANPTLDYADRRGLTKIDAWVDGYMDAAAGREKWHIPNCPNHNKC